MQGPIPSESENPPALKSYFHDDFANTKVFAQYVNLQQQRMTKPTFEQASRPSQSFQNTSSQCWLLHGLRTSLDGEQLSPKAKSVFTVCELPHVRLNEDDEAKFDEAHTYRDADANLQHSTGTSAILSFVPDLLL